MTTQEEYFEYLRGRSNLGYLYRKYLLYPKLCKALTGKTLDVGCGIGDFVNYRRNTVGVDINPLCIEWCKLKKLDVHQMTINKIPFTKSSFDSAVLDNV